MTDILSEIKHEAAYQFAHFTDILPNIQQLRHAISNSKGNIYAFGIGKSGNMAKHFTDLLKSISIPAFYSDSTDLLHGNIGTLKKNDVVILFSQSGNTKELLLLMPYFKQREVDLWAVTNRTPSAFEQFIQNIIHLPFQNEIRHDSIPTNSCMSQLLLANILVTLLKTDLSATAYRLNHPAGAIGQNLQKIKEIMRLEYPVVVLSNNMTLTSVLLAMTKWKMGCCFFIGAKGELLGLLTDGDIRRLLLKHETIHFLTLEHINTTFYAETDPEKLLKNCKNCHFIPVLNTEGILQGVVFNAQQIL
jgi:D-arabinose 5-phosphate isomerase GutQ